MRAYRWPASPGSAAGVTRRLSWARTTPELSERLAAVGIQHDPRAVEKARQVLAHAGKSYQRISISNSEVVSVEQKGDMPVRINKRLADSRSPCRAACFHRARAERVACSSHRAWPARRPRGTPLQPVAMRRESHLAVMSTPTTFENAVGR
jgi:hypothetical protein